MKAQTLPKLGVVNLDNRSKEGCQMLEMGADKQDSLPPKPKPTRRPTQPTHDDGRHGNGEFDSPSRERLKWRDDESSQLPANPNPSHAMGERPHRTPWKPILFVLVSFYGIYLLIGGYLEVGATPLWTSARDAQPPSKVVQGVGKPKSHPNCASAWGPPLENENGEGDPRRCENPWKVKDGPRLWGKRGLMNMKRVIKAPRSSEDAYKNGYYKSLGRGHVQNSIGKKKNLAANGRETSTRSPWPLAKGRSGDGTPEAIGNWKEMEESPVGDDENKKLKETFRGGHENPTEIKELEVACDCQNQNDEMMKWGSAAHGRTQFWEGPEAHPNGGGQMEMKVASHGRNKSNHRPLPADQNWKNCRGSRLDENGEGCPQRAADETKMEEGPRGKGSHGHLNGYDDNWGLWTPKHPWKNEIRKSLGRGQLKIPKKKKKGRVGENPTQAMEVGMERNEIFKGINCFYEFERCKNWGKESPHPFSTLSVWKGTKWQRESHRTHPIPPNPTLTQNERVAKVRGLRKTVSALFPLLEGRKRVVKGIIPKGKGKRVEGNEKYEEIVKIWFKNIKFKKKWEYKIGALWSAVEEDTSIFREFGGPSLPPIFLSMLKLKELGTNLKKYNRCRRKVDERCDGRRMRWCKIGKNLEMAPWEGRIGKEFIYLCFAERKSYGRP